MSRFSLRLGAVPVLIALMVCCLSGCGDDNFAGAYAKGIVTLNGQPLTDGVIYFNPAGEGSTASGLLGAEGKFSVHAGASLEGLYPGDYLVTLESWLVSPEHFSESGKYYQEGRSRIPRKYMDVERSAFKVTVTEAGPNEFTIALEGKPDPEK